MRRISLRPISGIATRARLRSCIALLRAPPISRPLCARSISGSIRGLRAPPATRCWRISKTWRRAAKLDPRGRRRSPAFIAWLALSLGVDLLRLLHLIWRFLGFEAVDRVVDPLGERRDTRRIGAEVVAAVARGRADVDARAVRIGADAHHHIVAEAEDRRAGHRLDARLAPVRLRRARIDDAPLSLVDHGYRLIEGNLRRGGDQQRLDCRVGALLQLGG